MQRRLISLAVAGLFAPAPASLYASPPRYGMSWSYCWNTVEVRINGKPVPARVTDDGFVVIPTYVHGEGRAS